MKVECSASVEDCSLAVGEIIGHENVKSASRMNNAVVLFLSTIDKANEVIVQGIVLNDSLTPVLPLSTPAKKVIISNVPPFIKDELIAKELQRHGQLVSHFRKIPLGCKSPLLRHLVSFRRQVYMVLNSGMEEIELTLKLRVEGFDYVVYATSDTALKCFSCGGAGHIGRYCPGKNANTEKEKTPAKTNESSTVVPPVTEVEPSVDGTEGSGLEGDFLIVLGPEAVAGESVVMEPAVAIFVAEELAAAGSCEPGNKKGPSIQTLTVPQTSVDVVEAIDIDPVFKAPVKRKMGPEINVTKIKKDEHTNDSDCESMDSNWSDCSQGDVKLSSEDRTYTADSINTFLHVTKGMRNVEVELHFPDCSQFISDAAWWIREGVFEDTAVFRLRKIMSKLRKKLRGKIKST